jgi:RND family efflux transporter MFP subunit
MYRVLIGILLTVLLNVGIFKWTRQRERLASAEAARAAQTLAVPPPPPPPPPAPERGFLGVILAGESVDLEPKVEGRIESVFVKPGDLVTRGTRIAQLEVRTLREELAVAKAGLVEAHERLARRVPLAAGGLGAVTREELSSARTQVVQERARVAQLEQQLAEANVTAPFDGAVAQQYLAPGALAGPGRPIARLITRGELRTRFAIPEDRVAQVAVGAHVRLVVAMLDSELTAKVVSLTPEVDVASRMVYGVATLDVPPALQPRLSNGMVARVFAMATPTSTATGELAHAD